MICKICGQGSNSWIHCKKDEFICDKCCFKCIHIDYSTSYINCRYKKNQNKK